MVEISRHIENAINNIENEKQRAIQTAVDKVQREKIMAHNVEVDQYKTNALAELQKKFEEERNNIIAKSEENKQTFAKNEIETITAIVVKEFDSKIAELKSLIKE